MCCSAYVNCDACNRHHRADSRESHALSACIIGRTPTKFATYVTRHVTLHSTGCSLCRQADEPTDNTEQIPGPHVAVWGSTHAYGRYLQTSRIAHKQNIPRVTSWISIECIVNNLDHRFICYLSTTLFVYVRALRECVCMMCACIHDRVQGLQLKKNRRCTAVKLELLLT